MRTAPVRVRAPEREIHFSGVTRAIERAAPSFTVGGRLIELRGRLGSRVSKGAVIARIEARGLENAVLEGDADLSRAGIQWRRSRREVERVKRLHEVGAGTRRSLEDALSEEEAARALVHAAESRLKEAERVLDEALLRAPFSGIISEVFLEPGEYAAPGSPVVMISGDGGLEVLFHVPEATASEIPLGAPVTIHFPVSDIDPLAARIRRITYVGLGGGLYPVVARFISDNDLMPGMSVEVGVIARPAHALLVPINAVVSPTGIRSAVFRVRNGRAEKIEVEPKQLFGDHVVVDAPLEEGDQVIVSGHGILLDGDPVLVPAAPAVP